MKLTFREETWGLKKPFRISYKTMHDVELIYVDLQADGLVGRGEAIGVNYLGETVQTMLDQLAEAQSAIETGITRDALQELLPPGGARNAVDCALWDLDMKRGGTDIWKALDMTPKPLNTVYTIGLDEPAAMYKDAAGSTEAMLKIKVDRAGAYEEIKAVRDARPDARLVIDANQDFKLDDLDGLLPRIAELGVEMVEQPLAAGEDAGLIDYKSPIPLCADESCQTSEDLDFVIPRYQMVNIKLDKTGGLTEALNLAERTRQGERDLMVGCMLGTSLSMAPSFVIGQMCTYVDIDGPLLMSDDRDHALRYTDGVVDIPDPKLWG